MYKRQVQGKGHNCQYVCINGGFRPGRINLGGSHIFNVIRIADIVIRGGGIGGDAVMHNDKFRDDDPA